MRHAGPPLQASSAPDRESCFSGGRTGSVHAAGSARSRKCDRGRSAARHSEMFSAIAHALAQPHTEPRGAAFQVRVNAIKFDCARRSRPPLAADDAQQVVVLPVPDGPTTAVTSLMRDVDVNAVINDTRTVAEIQPADAYQVRHLSKR